LLVEDGGHVEAAVMRASVKTITRSPSTVSVPMERKLLGGQRSSPSLEVVPRHPDCTANLNSLA